MKAAGLILSVALTAVCARGGDDKPPAPKHDPQALKILRASIDYLNGLKSYTTSLSYKETKDGGTRKKFRVENARYEVAVERPNKLAVAIAEGGLNCAVFSDGANVWAYAPARQQYAQFRAPRTLSEVFDIREFSIVNQDLGNSQFFLDQFHLSDAFARMIDGVLEIKIAGQEQFGAEKTTHLQFTLEAFEWHFWIQDGKQPLLRRSMVEGVRRMRDKDGDLEVAVNYVTQYDNWTVNEPVEPSKFVFTPPPDSKRVKSFLKDDNYDPKLLGELAPAVKGKLLDGGTFDLASQKGKNIVVLDFWATWCGPCRAAMPAISEVVDGYKGKGVVAYAVNLGEEEQKVASYQNFAQLKMPILLDVGGKIAEAYRVQPIPMTVIVGKDGSIQVVHLGTPGVEALKKKLTQELDTLLEGKTLVQPKERKGEPEAR